MGLDVLWSAETEWWDKFYYSQDNCNVLEEDEEEEDEEC